ncbi:hypothetical protein [Brevundimonas sp. FT23028]|uniref:hypothetical protein n=1 Tax=Brevundimonas sp. FT23028 TaxID=3393748 RepID=UPI003B5860BB
MRRLIRSAAVLAVMSTLAACVSTPAPTYQPSIANLQSLRSGTAMIGVDAFTANEGVSNRSFVLRGSTMSGSGVDGTFSTYLQEALEAELRNAGRFGDAAALRLSGTLTTNRLNAAGISTGDGAVGARFVLTRDGQVVYDKELTGEHQWPSSFIGAVAIPAAVQGYPATVEKLISLLFADPDFIAATR